jgi:hypothetical protein
MPALRPRVERVTRRRALGTAWAAGAGGAVMYWHVDDLEGTVQRLLSMGAREYQPVTPLPAVRPTSGPIRAQPVLGGLHNTYEWAA